MGFPGGSDSKESAWNVGETWVQSVGWEDPLEEGMTTHTGFLPGESHGQRSLAGYIPRGRKESDTTEWLNTQIMQFIGELREKSPKWWNKLFFPNLISLVCWIQVRPSTRLWRCIFPDLFLRPFDIPKHRALRTLKTYSKQTNHRN